MLQLPGVPPVPSHIALYTEQLVRADASEGHTKDVKVQEGRKQELMTRGIPDWNIQVLTICQ